MAPDPAAPRVLACGDSAILVDWGERIDPALNAQVHALAATAGSWAGPWGVPVPAYSSLLLPYDPGHLAAAEATAAVHAALAIARVAPPETDGEVVEIAVRYGGAGGPDLSEVAALRGLSEADVVRLHSGSVYRVYMLGFAPGFAYLGPLPDALVTPRRATPRSRVPAGSVAIAARQTGVYPLATPGGWNLIGHTGAPLWDPAREPPALLRPGQFVRFVPA
jgi:KipI family sensor histidine kinase inhibitor